MILLICALVYVDDTIAVSWKENATDEMMRAKDTMEGLMGVGSVADPKTEFTTPEEPKIVVLGYALAMDTQLLTVSNRNFHKAIYAFFSVNIDNKVPVPTMEKLASYAQRYSLICTILRPFTSALYASYAGRQRHVSVKLENGAQWAVRLWRTMLCCTALREDIFARTFESFRPRAAEYIIQFDASLNGVGIVIYKVDGTDGKEIPVGAGSVVFPWWHNQKDSSYQNTCEFTGALIGLTCLLQYCENSCVTRPKAVSFRGDSVSALTWIKKKTHRGERAFAAAALMALVMARYQIQVTEVIHVPEYLNKECDGLSRNRTVAALKEVADWKCQENIHVLNLLDLCNPLCVDFTSSNFEQFWLNASNFVSTFCSPPQL
jgi:hypothetical protein